MITYTNNSSNSNNNNTNTNTNTNNNNNYNNNQFLTEYPYKKMALHLLLTNKLQNVPTNTISD